MSTAAAPRYRDILATAIELVGSDAGSLQVADPGRRELRLVASEGFHPLSAEFWRIVPQGAAATCGTALATGDRVVVADVEAVAEFDGTADLREWRRSELRAVQSTPVIGADGGTVAMLSTHWRRPHEPDGDELRVVDALAPLADPEHLPLNCAWCGRIEVGGAFVEPPRGSWEDIPLLAERATHGICPHCLGGQLHCAAASRRRAQQFS